MHDLDLQSLNPVNPIAAQFNPKFAQNHTHDTRPSSPSRRNNPNLRAASHFLLDTHAEHVLQYLWRITMPRNRDYVPPTFTCWSCNRQSIGRAPLCPACRRRQARSELIQAPDGTYRKVYHRRALRPALDERDRDLLLTIARNMTSPEWLYHRAHSRQHGKCRRCRRRASTLRVVPTPGFTRVRSLICDNCLDQFPAAKAARASAPLTIEQQVWRMADPFLRALLCASPTFVAAMTPPSGRTQDVVP